MPGETNAWTNLDKPAKKKDLMATLTSEHDMPSLQLRWVLSRQTQKIRRTLVGLLWFDTAVEAAAPPTAWATRETTSQVVKIIVSNMVTRNNENASPKWTINTHTVWPRGDYTDCPVCRWFVPELCYKGTISSTNDIYIYTKNLTSLQQPTE
jgi:hypothetical protein